MLTAARLRELLDYDPATGVFKWKVNRRAAARCGDIAGGVDKYGYLIITIDGKRYVAQRLAWLHVHGEWPPSILDHRDWDKANNRLLNLRPSNHSKNALNVPGDRGIYKLKSGNGWTVSMTSNKTTRRLGCFKTYEAAVAARNEALEEELNASIQDPPCPLHQHSGER